LDNELSAVGNADGPGGKQQSSRLSDVDGGAPGAGTFKRGGIAGAAGRRQVRFASGDLGANASGPGKQRYVPSAVYAQDGYVARQVSVSKGAEHGQVRSASGGSGKKRFAGCVAIVTVTPEDPKLATVNSGGIVRLTDPDPAAALHPAMQFTWIAFKPELKMLVKI
jgi:hypothetical protein